MHVVTFGVGCLLTLWSGRALAAIGGKTVAAAASSSAKTRGLEVLTSAWTGLVAGCLHALTGPDHLAALAPLCIGRSKVESAAVGALWGVGHDAGQVLFGIAFLLLKDKLHIELIRTWGARVVGITLIAIGVVGIKDAQEVPVSCLAGNEQGQNTGQSSGSLKGVPVAKKSLGLTFATGLVYGLQPDALLMILPALALPSRFSGFAFLGMFLVGTVIAMGSYTAFIGSCSEALQERVPWITHRLTWASSLVAIAFGLGVLIGESFGINLF
ncbi:hypothetical protein O6H91_Y423000 [Diphasiastrum complanatum]|nr:hypothetical protein O6H91_Y423000 [Diphasiastrum complanatum]